MSFDFYFDQLKQDYGFLMDRQLTQLSKKRYKHVLGTAKVAYDLGQRYQLDIFKCVLGGYFHDFYREATSEELTRMAECYRWITDDYEKMFPKLLHGPMAAAYFKSEGLIDDVEILEGIECHTLGKKKMGPIAQVIFISDAIEETRKYTGVEALRKYVFSHSLSEGYYFVLKDFITSLLSDNRLVIPKTIEAYNEKVEEINDQFRKK